MLTIQMYLCEDVNTMVKPTKRKRIDRNGKLQENDPIEMETVMDIESVTYFE
jgi:hypothetical protein